MLLDVRPLRSSTFRHLATSLWVNEAGNAIGEVALALLVFDRTGSPLASAALFLTLRVLPSALAPLLATYAETMRPRITLPVIYLFEAGLFAAIATISARFSLPLVLILVACDGVLAIVSAALGRSAITNDLMPGGLLREGNGLINLGTMVAFAAGPAVGGALVKWHGTGFALRVDAGTFVCAALITATAAGLRIESDREAGTAGRLRAALEIVRTRPALRRLFLATVLIVGVSSVAVPIEVVFAERTLHAGSSGYGFLLGSWGVGMIVGAAAFALAREVALLRLLGVSVALVALGYGGLAVSPTLAVACACSFVGGTGNGAAWVAAMTAIQQEIPLSAQNAVMSTLYGLNQAVPGVGFVVGGVVTALSSPRVAYAISAVGTALALVAFSAVRPISRVRLTPVQDPPSDQEPFARFAAGIEAAAQEIAPRRGYLDDMSSAGV